MNRIALIIIIAAIFGAHAAAQDPDQITVGTRLVNINVTVTGPNGKFTGGLTRDQFDIYDNNVKQQLAFFSAEDSPSTIGIVYDLHPTTADRTATTLRALKQFTGALRPQDNFFIVAFNEHGTLSLDFIPTPDQVRDFIGNDDANGPTSLYDAINFAAGKMRASPNPKRALLIISDGADHNSVNTYKEVRARVRGFDVQLYAITLTDADQRGQDRWVFEDVTGRYGERDFLVDADAALGRAVLEELTRSSGGAAFPPNARGEQALIGICTQIAFELRRQYALGFYPTDTTSAHKPHRLKITVRDQKQNKLRLAYRTSYEEVAGSR